MFKQVTKTDAIKSQIAAAYGDPDVRTDDLAVFEAVAANTLPLRRRNGIYQGARLGHDVLAGMTDAINQGTHVPLQIMHRSGVPVGKVFAASLKPMDNGHTAMHAMFYLPKKESELVGKIDSGALNDVSVGMVPKQLLCSDCGWDYMGDDSTFENMWDCKCANGHELGKNGTHIRVHGLQDMSELSLVDRGAVAGASILPRPKQQMGKTYGSPERLAARGFDDSVFALFASATEPPTKTPENPKMDELIQLKAEHIVATRDLVESKSKLEAAVADVTRLQAQVAELQAAAAVAAKGDLVAIKAELTEAVAMIDELAAASLGALGKGGTALPETVSAKVALVRDARAQLALSIPTGGSARAAAKTDDKGSAPQTYGAFKRN